MGMSTTYALADSFVVDMVADSLDDVGDEDNDDATDEAVDDVSCVAVEDDDTALFLLWRLPVLLFFRQQRAFLQRRGSLHGVTDMQASCQPICTGHGTEAAASGSSSPSPSMGLRVFVEEQEHGGVAVEALQAGGGAAFAIRGAGVQQGPEQGRRGHRHGRHEPTADRGWDRDPDADAGGCGLTAGCPGRRRQATRGFVEVLAVGVQEVVVAGEEARRRR